MKLDLFGTEYDPSGAPIELKKLTRCYVDGCGNEIHRRGLCVKHYVRDLKYGDTSTFNRKTEFGEPTRLFLENIKIETDECIIWPYSNQIRFSGVRLMGVSSLVCKLRYGPKPGLEYEAIHGPCHNPCCMNYRHLSWGTPKQNALDRTRDGTQVFNRGSTNGQAKITEETAMKIRELYFVNGFSQAAIARWLNLHSRHVQKIVSGFGWRHLPMPPMKRKLIGRDLFS